MRQACLPLFILLQVFCKTSAYRSGAPNSACDDLTPGHGSELTGTVPFSVAVKKLETNDSQIRLQITLFATGKQTFRGFILQGRQVNGGNKALGNFTINSPDDSHAFKCHTDAKDTATHSDSSSKSSLTFEWIPPVYYPEGIVFHATVAEDRSAYWKGITSDEISLAVKPSALVTTKHATTKPVTTQPPVIVNSTHQMINGSVVTTNNGSTIKTTIGTPTTTSKATTTSAIIMFVISTLVLVISIAV